MSLELKKYVIETHKIDVGHFRLNSRYCARDWIDTKDIVENKDIMAKIVKLITRDIMGKTNDYDKFMIVGIDLEGVAIASRVATILQRPFTYVVPVKDKDENSKKDFDINIEGQTKMIFITDTVVTLETVQSIVKRFDVSIEKNIIAIYSVFYRKSKHIIEENSGLLYEKLMCLNDDFNIEIFEMKNCIYRDTLCFANNRRS